MEAGLMIKIYTQEGNKKLNKQYLGTKQAITQIAYEKMQGVYEKCGCRFRI